MNTEVFNSKQVNDQFKTVSAMRLGLSCSACRFTDSGSAFLNGFGGFASALSLLSKGLSFSASGSPKRSERSQFLRAAFRSPAMKAISQLLHSRVNAPGLLP
jgi:hypothetical protein